jgi:uncharacterized cupredoxin-like copper-binding protein
MAILRRRWFARALHAALTWIKVHHGRDVKYASRIHLLQEQGMRTKFLTIPLALALMAGAAQADTLVRVTLIDKSGAADASAPRLGMGMHADMSKAKMAINANPDHLRKGVVRFDVTNLASSIVHEVIVARVESGDQVLPYDESRAKVDAEQLYTLGSVNEIAPNKSVSLTLNLTPGKYLLYCNISGHYIAGMWTVIDVE